MLWQWQRMKNKIQLSWWHKQYGIIQMFLPLAMTKRIYSKAVWMPFRHSIYIYTVWKRWFRVDIETHLLFKWECLSFSLFSNFLAVLLSFSFSLSKFFLKHFSFSPYQYSYKLCCFCFRFFFSFSFIRFSRIRDFCCCYHAESGSMRERTSCKLLFITIVYFFIVQRMFIFFSYFPSCF